MVPVLAFYKIGNIDNDAGNGKNEWINSDNIIVKQIESVKSSNLLGYALFRYDYMYNVNMMNKKSVNEMINLKKIN